MKKQFLSSLFVLCVIILPLYATAQEVRTQRFGISTDLASYVVGEIPDSFSLQAWYGIDRWKFGASIAQTKLRSSLTDDDFEDQEALNYGVFVEYFFGLNIRRSVEQAAQDRLSGLWLGANVTYTDGEITSQKTQIAGDYDYFAAGLNLGYAWRYNYFYIAPHIGVTIPLGDREFAIGDDDTYTAKVGFVPGLKVGFEF